MGVPGNGPGPTEQVFDMLHPTDLPNLHRHRPGLGHGTTLRAAASHRAAAEAVAPLFAAPTPAEVDPADTGTGDGWAVVVLRYDGTAEVLATVPTAGAAAEVLATAEAAHPYDGTARVVGVPAYAAAAMVGG